MNTLDVVVVGAGPAGSVAAAALAAQGHRVALLDRARFPRDKPCGDYCDPGSVRLLEMLGVLPEVIAQGAGIIDGMTIVAQDGVAFSAPFPTGRALLIPRRRLDAVLVERAVRNGAALVEGFQVDRVTIDESVSVTGPARRTGLRSHLLIAADGMRSVVARRLGLLDALPKGRYTAGAYFSGVPGGPAGELHLGDGFYGGVARFGDGSANVCLALPRERMRGHTVEAAFAAAVRDLPALRDEMRNWTRETPFRVTGPVGFAWRRPVAARALLAGDAALQIEPITGQGICFALQSGLLASEQAATALERGAYTVESLGSYSRKRARALGGRLRLLKAVTALALRGGVAPRLVRRLRSDPTAAQTLLGATGDVLPAGAVFSLPYLIRLLTGAHAHDT
ncbi:MAG TPA: FAD-dependent monooxygenase [bacterium]